MTHRKPPTAEIERRVETLISSFESYLAEFDSNPAFTEEQLRCHLETCRLREVEQRDAASAARDERFLRSLWETLRSWRMQARGAKLVDWPRFRDAFGRCIQEIAYLDGFRLDSADLPIPDVSKAGWQLIDRLALADNTSKLVAGTKALHHLMPRLIVPMDRAYSGAFFGWSNYDWQAAQPKTLRVALESFSRIAAAVNPSKYVGDRWRSSATKVIDNAIVGFCRKHLLDERSCIRALEARARELGILDQIKEEAKRRAQEST